MSECAEATKHPALNLANRVINARDQHPYFKLMVSHAFLLTDEALLRLIRLAYDASLMEEEGRLPRCRIVVSKLLPSISFGKIQPWDSITLNKADELRKIAPTAKRPGSALAVMTAEPEGLRCIGIHEFEEIIEPNKSMTKSNIWEGPEALEPPLLSIRIEGPGKIRAGFLPAESFILHGGEIRERSSWIDITTVSDLFKDLGKSVHARIAQISHPLIKNVCQFPMQCENVLVKMWGHLLAVAIATRHGGAFVIRLDDSAAGVSESKSVVLQLGHLLMAAIEDSHRFAGDNFQAFRRAWEGRRLTLFSRAEQIAGLSAIDGCVLMDRQLNLQAFGAKLESKDQKSNVLEGTGMRHRSAYNFCVENKAVAFIVSQDGQLTVIESSEKEPKVFRDVDPDVQWSQM